MRIRALDELAKPDERTLLFTPWGLSMGGHLSVEDALAFQQQAISACDLVGAVPEGTRQVFERLRELHIYGVLSYDMFTVADQQAPLVLDLALRERFMAYYKLDGVPLVSKTRGNDRLRVSSFEDLYEALNHGSHRKGGWKLDLDAGPIPFRGSFGELFRWARKVGLLHGQRNRRIEQALVKLRNYSAHPGGHIVVSPVESARAIRDTAEIINRLWGHATPGGRLFPAPIQQEIIAVGWDQGGDQLVQFRAHPGREGVDPAKSYVLLRAVEHDPDLWEYDSHFETTAYPAELLWGPGLWAEAEDWLVEHRPQPGETEYLDRLFLVRTFERQVERPRRPEVALGLSTQELVGTWHLIRADHPSAAFGHVRGPGGNPNPDCAREGPCSRCAVEAVSVGPWEQVAGYLTDFDPIALPSISVPSKWR